MEEEIERIEATATIPITLEIKGKEVTAIISQKVLVESLVSITFV